MRRFTLFAATLLASAIPILAARGGRVSKLTLRASGAVWRVDQRDLVDRPEQMAARSKAEVAAPARQVTNPGAERPASCTGERRKGAEARRVCAS